MALTDKYKTKIQKQFETAQNDEEILKISDAEKVKAARRNTAHQALVLPFVMSVAAVLQAISPLAIPITWAHERKKKGHTLKEEVENDPKYIQRAIITTLKHTLLGTAIQTGEIMAGIVEDDRESYKEIDTMRKKALSGMNELLQLINNALFIEKDKHTKQFLIDTIKIDLIGGYVFDTESKNDLLFIPTEFRAEIENACEKRMKKLQEESGLAKIKAGKEELLSKMKKNIKKPESTIQR